MELIKKNIHMDRVRTEAVTQFAAEDDINIPDSRPDVNTLNLSRGEVVIEEIRPGTDMVSVKGRLSYRVLYHTLEEGSSLVLLEGNLPFVEKVNLRGALPADSVCVEGEAEDLTVGIINSRKLNLQALITLTARVEELYDEEIPVGVRGEEKAEYRKVPMELTQIAICKNDIFRIKEEISLPSNYPNILRILWETVSLGDVEFKAGEEKIGLSGDVHLFLLYEGEGEEHPIRSFESTTPFSGSIDCHGCREGMIPDIRYKVGQKELAVRPDFDGEERSIGMELMIDLGIRIYEEEEYEVITDVYGVRNEVETVTYKADLRKLLCKVTGKTKVTDRIQVRGGKILQLLHSQALVSLDKQTVVENGLLLQGSLHVKVMYIAGEDEAPYGCSEAQIPYQYTLEVPGISAGDSELVRAEAEQLQVTVLDGEEMDVKAVLCFSTVVLKKTSADMISQVNVKPLETGKLKSLPGMVIYVVKEGDNLWNIGKKYYVSVDKIKKLNGMESDELTPGRKLLIVKGS